MSGMPCGYIMGSRANLPTGERCGAPEAVHRGEHEYVPWDRRSGRDRRLINVDRLRDAARRAGLPREVTVADIENLAAELDRPTTSTERMQEAG